MRRTRRTRWTYLLFIAVASLFPGVLSAHPGTGIVVDRLGNVYVVDMVSGVWQLDKRGTLTHMPGPGFHWLALDNDDRFANTRLPSGSGGDIARIGSRPTLLLGSDVPIVLGADGNLYYPTHGSGIPLQIMRLQPTGQTSVLANISATPTGESLRDLNGLAAGPDGSLYYTEDRAIRRVDMKGAVTTIADNVSCNGRGNSAKEPNPLLRGLDIDGQGVIYVAATGCRAVLKVARGQVTRLPGAPVDWTPTGVIVFGSDLYILEFEDGNSDDRCTMLPRIHKLSSDGRSAVIGTASRGRDTRSTQMCGQARVEYTLRAELTDLSVVTVEMRIHRALADFRVAMVAHTEYDDKYWRHLSDLHVVAPAGAARVTREDSSVWRVVGANDEVTLRYSVHLPQSSPQQQAAWKAHLTPEGGLVGGPHSFLYVVGGEQWPSMVKLDLPASWSVATGLDTTNTPRTFTAADVVTLTDSPILVGLFRSWRFDVDGIEHRLAYLGHPGGASFDTIQLVGQVERLTRETVRMFGSMPYRRFHFLFEDGAYGGLEHLNSVSIGARSATLARDPNALLTQIAHEFFHTWNEVHLRPASWIGVRHAAPTPTGELWWSEGVTLFYADLLLRRAGLPAPDSTRLARLTRLLTIYAANPSHALVSPEATSRAFNLPPSALGDYTPSMFTQGELLGVVLDLLIRGETSGAARSMMQCGLSLLGSQSTADSAVKMLSAPSRRHVVAMRALCSTVTYEPPGNSTSTVRSERLAFADR